ncbi:hypothetical protein KIMH_01130 [Bombiscardovia apis]|uniref:Uncharacterized protein n=2 Tax=Bombiscardovia apis TaxID=2932182 RepID=A0ABN6SFG1_9BIFI|nr:hypothetical protein KIMH_01130 [Bombiscardovia apis]
MKYVTGLNALNLGERDDTPGDWHYSALDWERPMILDTERSPFGAQGVGLEDVPGRGIVPTANHVRACLDLIEQGYFSDAQGMRENFISNESHTPEILQAVWALRERGNWPAIDRFMGREYLTSWLVFKRSQLLRQE